jgi:hypothetical protein
LSVELLDDLLRLHPLPLFGLFKRERVLRLPRLDLVEPLLAFVVLDLGDEPGEGGGNVAENGDLSLDDLVDVLGHDLEVDDATLALESGGARGWCEGCEGWWRMPGR